MSESLISERKPAIRIAQVGCYVGYSDGKDDFFQNNWPSGETGRRTGLKILWDESPVRVRTPSRLFVRTDNFRRAKRDHLYSEPIADSHFREKIMGTHGVVF